MADNVNRSRDERETDSPSSGASGALGDQSRQRDADIEAQEPRASEPASSRTPTRNEGSGRFGSSSSSEARR